MTQHTRRKKPERDAAAAGPTRAAGLAAIGMPVGVPVAGGSILDVGGGWLRIHTDACRVIAAVLQPPQAGEQAVKDLAAVARHAVIVITKDAAH